MITKNSDLHSYNDYKLFKVLHKRTLSEGFGQIFTGKVGFGSLGLGFGHWEWELQTEKQ